MAPSRTASISIALATLTAFVIRVAAGHGGLWLDEAWSAVFAHRVGTPIGALRIGHDNNHLINTWWLQLAGWPATPLSMRALSILCGTIAVPVAASIASRRGQLASTLAAWLFAASPALVTFGAEARGYAPMLLALLIAIRLIDRHLAAPEAPTPAIGLAFALGFGTLAHMTILFAIPALVGWILWARRGDRPLAHTAMLLGPGIAVAGIIAAAIVGTGLTMGAYEPFGVGPWLTALGLLTRFTLAVAWLTPPLLLVAVACGVFALVMAQRDDAMAALFVLAILIFPIVVAGIGIGNSGHPRYYLTAATLLLLAIAQAPRIAALPLTVIVLAGSLVADLELVANRRADPAAAVATMARLSPRGARYGVEAERDTAVMDVAAAQAGYAATLTSAPCPAPEYLFVTRDGAAPFPAEPTRCDVRYLPIAGAPATGLSGSHWQLYLRVP